MAKKFDLLRKKARVRETRKAHSEQRSTNPINNNRDKMRARDQGDVQYTESLSKDYSKTRTVNLNNQNNASSEKINDYISKNSYQYKKNHYADHGVNEMKKLKQNPNQSYESIEQIKARENGERLPNMTNGLLRTIGATAKTVLGSGIDHFSKEGNVKNAFKGVVKSTALNATVSGGMAAMQGEDPWDAAKSGAVRGAFLGAGYMGLKGSLASSKKLGKGGTREMASTVRDVYRSHTLEGQKQLRRDGLSRPLKQVLEQNKRTERASNFYGF